MAKMPRIEIDIKNLDIVKELCSIIADSYDRLPPYQQKRVDNLSDDDGVLAFKWTEHEDNINKGTGAS